VNRQCSESNATRLLDRTSPAKWGTKRRVISPEHKAIVSLPNSSNLWRSH